MSRLPRALCLPMWALLASALAPGPAMAEAGLEDGPCPMHAAMDEDARARVRCVSFEVAETATAPSGRRLRLQAAVVSPRGPAQGPPLLFLHGGPGGQAVRAARWFLSAPLGQRTVVLLDQRASGESKPELCPDLREADLALTVRGLDADASAAARLQLFSACRDDLRRSGVDLNAYSPAAVVGDAEALRRALGIERWDLLGVSFGTRIALAYRAIAPQSIRAMVLDSVSPPGAPFFLQPAADLWRALRALDARCAADTACQQRWGRLETAVTEAAERLQRQPLRLPVDDVLAVDGTIPLSATTFLVAMQQLLYDRELYPIVPLLVDRIREGDGASLRHLAAQLLMQTRRGDRIDVIAAFECPQLSAGVPALRESVPAVARALDDWRRWTTDLCPMWVEGGRFDPPARPVASGPIIPSLVLAGAIDPITPPAGSRGIAQALGGAYVELAQTGHGVILEACGKALATAFLDRPGESPDAACASAEAPVAFVQAALLVPQLGATASRLVEQRSAAGLAALASIVAGLAGAVLWIGVARRTVSSGPRHGPVLALAALCVLTFGVALAVAVALTARQQPTLLLLGVPALWLPAFALPWIAVAGLLRSAWLRVVQGRPLRIQHSIAWGVLLLSLAALGALGLLWPTLI